jgi:polyphosphate kinase
MFTENKKFLKPVQAISIVDEYLEHARVYIFHNDGNEKVFISSADLMVRNLDHRVEATCPILDENIKKVLKTILEIQLNDNVKARILDNDLSNWYVRDKTKRRVRSQVEIYNYLYQKTLEIPQTLQPAPMENPLITDGLEIISETHETGSN